MSSIKQRVEAKHKALEDDTITMLVETVDDLQAANDAMHKRLEAAAAKLQGMESIREELSQIRAKITASLHQVEKVQEDCRATREHLVALKSRIDGQLEGRSEGRDNINIQTNTGDSTGSQGNENEVNDHG